MKTTEDKRTAFSGEDIATWIKAEKGSGTLTLRTAWNDTVEIMLSWDDAGNRFGTIDSGATSLYLDAEALENVHGTTTHVWVGATYIRLGSGGATIKDWRYEFEHPEHHTPIEETELRVYALICRARLDATENA